MEQERFEELLLAELDGSIEPDGHAELRRLCQRHPELNDVREEDHYIAGLLRSRKPSRAPEALVEEILYRLQEIPVEEEAPAMAEEEEMPPPLLRIRERGGAKSALPPVREIAERDYELEDDRRTGAPWWSALFGSPFLRLGFALAVVGVFGYMGNVIVRQSRERGQSLLPNVELPDWSLSELVNTVAPTPVTPLKAVADSAAEKGAPDLTTGAEKAAAPAEKAVAMAEVSAPHDTYAFVRENPAAPAEGEQPPTSDAEAEADAEAETAADAPPSVSLDLPKNAERSESEAARVVAQAAKPAAEANEKGMAEVFGRLREEQAGQDGVRVNPATAAGGSASLAPNPNPQSGVLVTDSSQLREQLRKASRGLTDSEKPAPQMAAARQEGAVSAPAAPAAVAPPSAPVVIPAAVSSDKAVVSDVDELRKSLALQKETKAVAEAAPAKPAVDLSSISEQRPATVPIVPAQVKKAMTGGQALQETTRALTDRTAPPTVQRSLAGPAQQTGSSASASTVRQVEMAIAREGGSILKKGADSRDPSLTRLTCRMTQDQKNAFVRNLEKIGIKPGASISQSGAAFAIERATTPQAKAPQGASAAMDFDVVVKSRP